MLSADALAAYCRVLLRSPGRARIPWNEGFVFEAKSPPICALATIADRREQGNDARAPANKFHNARQTVACNLSPTQLHFDVISNGVAR